ncbi:MAG: hypothetical protein ACREIL_00615 [Nitrospiraceae bacterium]
MDKETGQPIVDAHALAEWQLYGYYGRNGPLMVQDAVSQADGVLTFPAWGPLRGSRAGLVINSDPVVSFFKPGYKALIVTNAIPIGLNETEQVRGFFQNGQTFALEPFRGNPEEWVDQLRKVWLGLATPRGDDKSLAFRGPYLNRLLRVWAERERLPERFRLPGQFFWSVEGAVKFLEEGRR